MALRFMTAGDSHGDSLVGIIEGLPAGIRISTKDIERDLLRRRKTYGRSDRQLLESDRVEVISGLWRGRTTGAPLALRIPNLGRDVRKRTGGALATAEGASCRTVGLGDGGPEGRATEFGVRVLHGGADRREV